MPAAPMDFSDSGGSEAESDDGGDGVIIANPMSHPQPTTRPRSASNQITSLSARSSPTADEVERALISSTNERLYESPKALDFGVVKQRAEAKLGVLSDFWGKSEHDEWFAKSKNIIKMAVVSLHALFFTAPADRASYRKIGSNERTTLHQRTPRGCCATSKLTSLPHPS